MATHSSILAWRIPGMEEPGGLPSMESHRVGHDWSDLAAAWSYINRHQNFIVVEIFNSSAFTVSSFTWFQFLEQTKFITVLEIVIRLGVGDPRVSRNHTLFLAFVSLIMLVSIFQMDFLYKPGILAADSSDSYLFNITTWEKRASYHVPQLKQARQEALVILVQALCSPSEPICVARVSGLCDWHIQC